MKSLGICLGASTVTFVEISNNNNNIKIDSITSKVHEGNAKQNFLDILKKVNPENFDRITVTGRKFRENVNLTTITEPEAVEYSLDYLKLPKNSYNVLVSAGGETTIVYELDQNHKINKVHIGNKCASGTGEFFLQQIRRMDLEPGNAIELAKNKHPHKISGRCSVFCKSDCTHALNRGEEKGAVVAGLCKMISGKITELLSSINPKKVIMTGGVTKNSIVVDYLGKQVDELLIPGEAHYFEALGAALYGLQHSTEKFTNFTEVYNEGESSFEFLSKLTDHMDKVSFKSIEHGKCENNKTYILGIDVGSTTTKAVLIDKETGKITADIYLRTNGNPVEAARNCYKEIKKQSEGKKIKITGLGVTGSGRQIVGLHAFTDSIINEIIAHAAASVFFDKDVDTIFEIGGQDAKYTYIIDGVPADYAMNEACSAGTGSFLEESALETLGVKMEDIGDIALKAQNPPNFNDQCAAFIGSDIKVASQEGINREDMVAGLVYSICMNYNNRVKGNRRTGNKVFMQGGVCYNKAVPVAMAALTGKDIIVPPDPGLMGAFGVALEVKKRLENNLLEPKEFDLDTLINRNVEYGKPFKCAGGKEKCDIGCEILRIIIDGKTYAFGGACNKYYNLIHKLNFNEEELDIVAKREKLIFGKYAPAYETGEDAKIIGINRSFYTNSYYPLYYNFFSKLGFRVVRSDNSTKEGEDSALSSFCYPMLLAHGFFDDLIKKEPDYIFMPHLVQLETEQQCNCNTQRGDRKSCVFNQGEAFSLQTAFKNKLDGIEMLIPLVDFSRGIEKEKNTFVNLAVKMLYCNKSDAARAFDEALIMQREFGREIKETGKKILENLEKNPDKIGIVLFGRPYNAFTEKANLGIPRKFTSRGIEILPYDVLEYENETFEPFMHWGMGETILKAAQIVKKHPQLYGTYITNFSCGPDSFLVELFREEMHGKPALTLELDSHSADAGVNTRIEAFLDVVRFYRELQKTKKQEKVIDNFIPARVEGMGMKAKIYLSDGKTTINANTDKYTFLFPSLSRYVLAPANEYVNRVGIRGRLVPPTTADSIRKGRSQSSSKECLPMAMMLGNVMKYIENREPDEVLVLLHGTDTSPCRLEQYYNTFNNYIKRNKIENFAVFRVDDRDGYAGFGTGLLLNLFKSWVLGDVLETIKNAMRVLAVDPDEAINILEEEFQKIMDNFGGREKISLDKRLKLTAKRFSEIPRKGNLEDAKFVTVTGEIYVRNDHFGRRNIEGFLADRGFIAHIIPFMEVMFYIDYCLMNDLSEININPFKKIYFFFKSMSQSMIDKKIKNTFANCGFYKPFYIDIKSVINASRHIVTPYLRGEVPITTGAAIKYILNPSAGVISIGPFACLPSRMVESLLKTNMTIDHKIKAMGEKPLYNELKESGVKNLPFLAIESDGNPFTQVTLAQLEVFCLQANRMHKNMVEAKRKLMVN